MKVVLKWRSSNKYKGIVEPITLQSLLSINVYSLNDIDNLKEIEKKMGVTGIIALLNFAIPQVTNLIVAIRHRDGTQSAVVYLDEADAQFAANQKQIQDWIAGRGQQASTGTVTAQATPVAKV